MKKKIYFISVCMFALLISCTKSEIQTNKDSGDCIVTINPIGDILTSDKPLSKAATNNVYMLQVYQNDTSYAVGLFDDLVKAKVFLHKGLRYKFIISVAYDAKSYLPLEVDTLVYITKSGVSSFDYSFLCRKGNPNSWSNSSDLTLLTNNLSVNSAYSSPAPRLPFNTVLYCFKRYSLGTYTLKNVSSQYHSGSSDKLLWIQNQQMPNIGSAVIKGEISPTTLNDWFYGEATFTPTGGYQTLDMNFKRVGYKLKYELDGVTDGDVTVTIKTQSGKVLIQNTTNTETYSGDAIFVPFYDIASVYQNPSSYFENLIVSVSWLRGIGVTQDLGSTTIQVKRNNLNRVRIHLGNSDAGAAMNLSTEAESMGAESTDITIE